MIFILAMLILIIAVLGPILWMVWDTKKEIEKEEVLSKYTKRVLVITDNGEFEHNFKGTFRQIEFNINHLLYQIEQGGFYYPPKGQIIYPKNRIREINAGPLVPNIETKGEIK